MFDILLSKKDEMENPLYLQIYNQLRTQILSGDIPSNKKLPSIRAMQLQLNISKTPIEIAYQMLSAEGFAYSKPRSGYFAVNTGEFRSPKLDTHSNPLLNSQQTKERMNEKKYIIDFNPSAVDQEMFPIRTWKKMLNNVLEDYTRSIGQYGDMQGEYALRKELADYLRSSRGVLCSPEQIIIGTGISYSINILTKLIKGIQYVAFEEPGFDTVREQFLLNGYELIPVKVHHDSFHIKNIETSRAQMIYVTPSHQFPTGRIMPYSEREYLLHVANNHDMYIIEDDYDGEFRYIGKPIPSLQGLDRHGRVIYIGTFSKAFTPALRMNYMVIPPGLLNDLEEIRHVLLCPSRIDQWAMLAFIEQGHWYRHIRRMRNKYRRKHARLIQMIHKIFGDKIEITGHSAGLHIQITVKTKLSVQNLVQLAADKGVRVYDFLQMWLNPARSEYPKIYLGFAGINESDMEKGILLLKEAWANIFID